MNVSLSSDLEKLVNDKVRAGLYPTPSDVIGEGLRLLRERDERLASLRAEIRIGFEAIARGDYEDYDERTTKKLAAGIKARGRERLAVSKRPAIKR